jgi:nucleotide-binding universal stress UspA family protein
MVTVENPYLSVKVLGVIPVLEKIIVALDCSEISTKVIQALQTLHLGAETQIILSHVIPSPEPDEPLPVDRPHQSQEALYQNIEKELHYYQSQIPGSTLELVNGDPAEEIVRLANIYNADLIVIGTRGLKGFERVISGSVSGQVLADAPCSVFVVKS